MTRHTIVNPKTGRLVFKTGALGQAILKKQRKRDRSKQTNKASKKKANAPMKKKDKRTLITFKYQKAMISAQDMVDAGFECEKTVAVCVWDKNKKKLLTERTDGTAYWSSTKI